MVNIYAAGKRVACHVRSRHQAAHTTLDEHMPQAHRHQASWTPERFEQWSADIGAATHQIVMMQLKKRRHPEQSFRSVMALLSLAKQYDRVRLERACARAIEIGSPTRTSVLSILKKGLDHLSTEIQQEMFDDDDHLNAHDNLRGAQYYH